MQENKKDLIRLQHILDAILEIDRYCLEASFDSFSENSMMRFACIKQIEIIGEASNAISVSTREKISDIEWKQIIGLRHILVHEYFGIDEKLIWEIIRNDLPELKTKIIKLLSELS